MQRGQGVVSRESWHGAWYCQMNPFVDSFNEVFRENQANCQFALSFDEGGPAGGAQIRVGI